ncbi:MAG: [acyl-carrier-protein] S-malonyltransferase [Glaciecola sp.]|jgi:[acyl-carrier-protein] S-malonyltransferase
MARGIAFVYPGQGSHRADMAAPWHGTPHAQVIDQLSAAVGLDLATVANDAEACGASTAIGQPSIMAASLAADRALRAAGVIPDVVAGHSLGEVTAAAAAGVLTLAAAGEVVAERGRSMGDACRSTPGSMAAVVKMDRLDVEAILADFDGVTIANENAVGQVVVSGAMPLFEGAVAALKAAGGRAIALRVEGAFHSPVMTPAVVCLDAVLRRQDLADPMVPLVTGVSGEVLRSASAVQRNLIDGILSPVQWVAVQDRLLALGVEVLVEVGPGGVLSALARRAHPGLLVASVSKPEDIAAVVALVTAAPAHV